MASVSDEVTHSTASQSLYARVTTSNAPLTLDISDIRPPGSTRPDLQLRTRNYLEDTRVTIGPTFECNFAAQTKLSKINVKNGATLPQDDPTGADRIRVLKVYQEEANSVSGWVSYEKPETLTSTYPSGMPSGGLYRPYIQGDLNLESTLAPIYLNFEP